VYQVSLPAALQAEPRKLVRIRDGCFARGLDAFGAKCGSTKAPADVKPQAAHKIGTVEELTEHEAGGIQKSSECQSVRYTRK